MYLGVILNISLRISEICGGLINERRLLTDKR